jgi:hypothetical protein
MLKLPVRESSTFCMLGWVRATTTLGRDGGADRGLARAEWTAQLPRLRSVMRARDAHRGRRTACAFSGLSSIGFGCPSSWSNCFPVGLRCAERPSKKKD